MFEIFENDNKNQFEHYMKKEICEIPDIVKKITKNYDKNGFLTNVEPDFFDDIKNIQLIACGTSYHACNYGAILLNNLGFDATTYLANEFAFEKHFTNKNTLCVFVSQSGETADTIAAIKTAKKQKAKTIAITNAPNSTIAKMCKVHINMNCGEEVAIASTKTYIAQLVVMIYLANKLAKKQKTINANKLANAMDIVGFENQIKPIVKEVVGAKTIFMLGKNLDLVTATESALKLKETTYINCQAIASGEIKHGPISLVDDQTLVFAFVCQHRLKDKTLSIAKQTKQRGAKVCVVSAFDDVLNDECVDFAIKLPKLEEKLLPLVAILPMQLLAYNVCLELGYNPDKPRNLVKAVTD